MDSAAYYIACLEWQLECESVFDWVLLFKQSYPEGSRSPMFPKFLRKLNSDGIREIFHIVARAREDAAHAKELYCREQQDMTTANGIQKIHKKNLMLLKEIEDAMQVLGKALHYPSYPICDGLDYSKAPAEQTAQPDSNWICTGDHTLFSLCTEAANMLQKLTASKQNFLQNSIQNHKFL